MKSFPINATDFFTVGCSLEGLDAEVEVDIPDPKLRAVIVEAIKGNRQVQLHLSGGN